MTGRIFSEAGHCLGRPQNSNDQNQFPDQHFLLQWFVVGAHSRRLGKKLVLPIVVLGSPSAGFD